MGPNGRHRADFTAARRGRWGWRSRWRIDRGIYAQILYAAGAYSAVVCNRQEDGKYRPDCKFVIYSFTRCNGAISKIPGPLGDSSIGITAGGSIEMECCVC